MEQDVLRKVQLTQLEIAKEVKRVCDENNIRYFLYRGTFLGAVRHKGFIPWDDDMDFGMLRSDYEKFCRIAQEKLNAAYCFQNWHTDRNYALPFGKVRKRNTVFVEAKCARLPENGIYIDIYPLDFAPESDGERRILAKRLLHLFRVKLMKSGYTPWMEGNHIVWKKRIGYFAYQMLSLFVSQEELIRRYETLVLTVPESGTLYEQSALPIAYYFDREWCAEVAEYPFENTTFCGPKQYDAFLTSLYGDYMQLPPEDKRENRHQIQVLDLGE